MSTLPFRSVPSLLVVACAALPSMPAAQESPAPGTAPPASAAAEAGKPEVRRLDHALLFERGAGLAQRLPAFDWIPGTAQLAIETDLDGEARIVVRTPGNAEETELLRARALWERLGRKVPADTPPPPLPPWRFADGTTLSVRLDDGVVHLPLQQDGTKRVLAWPGRLDDLEFGASLAVAPGDAGAAWLQGRDLHVVDREGVVRRLTWDGSADVLYGEAAHRAEFGIQQGMFWSPDGRRLAFYREDLRGVDETPYEDLRAMPPMPLRGRYPMAGRAQGKVKVGVYDLRERSLCWLEHDPDADLFWTNVTFAPGGDQLWVALVSRGQDRLELARFDARSGKRLATVLVEQDAEWIEPENGPTVLADGRFLWWSSRDGHRHLWLHAPDGALLGQVTKGAFDVQRLLGTAPDGSGLWFAASGEDPRQLHLFFAKLDGSEVRQVTRERGTHECTLAEDGAWAVDVWSNLETPPVLRLIDLRSGEVAPLPTPPSPLAGLQLPAQRMFQVKADEETILYGHALMPREIPAGKRLPALLYVYGGPHVQLVQDRWLAGASLWLHAFANEGYVVCRLDNRGTPHRGIEFEQAVFRRLGTLEVQDQLRAVEWLAQQPFVDKDRIGVHGWSFGGYLTLRLLLLAPGTFRCGVAGAPVTDWAMYETGYTERYMDTPAENPAGYAASSCLPLAPNLVDRLLVVHGTDDRTVLWPHTLAFVDRCIDAGVLLDYFPYPMERHALRGPRRLHFQRLLKDWLDRHLEPGK